jgi:hypothetical protein
MYSGRQKSGPQGRRVPLKLAETWMKSLDISGSRTAYKEARAQRLLLRLTFPSRSEVFLQLHVLSFLDSLVWAITGKSSMFFTSSGRSSTP